MFGVNAPSFILRKNSILSKHEDACVYGSNLSFNINISSQNNHFLSNKIRSTYEQFDSNQDRPIEWFFKETKKEQRVRSVSGFQGFSKFKCSCLNTVA